MHKNKHCTVITYAHQLQDLQLHVAEVERETDGELCSSGDRGTDDEVLPVCTCTCSTHDCGCMIDGSGAVVSL